MMPKKGAGYLDLSEIIAYLEWRVNAHGVPTCDL